MGNRYKHKTLGWIAQMSNTSYNYFVSGKTGEIPKELIEKSSDREEIKDVEVCGNGMMIKGKGDGGVECVFRGHFKDMKSGMVFDHKLKALYKIREWHAKNDGFMPDWSGNIEGRCSLYYGYRDLKFIVGVNPKIHDVVFMPTFSGTETAKQCIKECKPELNILFDIKE